jgi:rare lipoprotein A
MALTMLLVFCGIALAEGGKASYYKHGYRTASGERFNPHGDTCAHRRHAFGTKLKVKIGNRSIICRVNDRGPFVRGRIIDLSYGAAMKIGLVGRGVANVYLEKM